MPLYRVKVRIVDGGLFGDKIASVVTKADSMEAIVEELEKKKNEKPEFNMRTLFRGLFDTSWSNVIIEDIEPLEATPTN